MKKILLINGPNLNMLGIREPGVYGNDTLSDLESGFAEYARAHGCDVECFQSNHEGDLIDKIHAAHGACDGIVYNPGAHTHYSYALRDALGSVSTPCVEVHISDVSAREDFRQRSFVRATCIATVMGKGFDGYCEAMDILLKGAQAE